MYTKTLNDFSREAVQVMPILFREFMRREGNDLTRGRISFPQMVALEYVSQRRRVSMTELSHILSIKTSSASVLVDRLVRDRMLSRSRDQEDRRMVWVSSTPKGRKVVNRILHQKRQSLKAIFSCLTDRERCQYLSALMKVKKYLLREAAG